MGKTVRPVTWPGLIALVVVLFLGAVLYRHHQVDKAYGQTIVAQSLSFLLMGRQRVEASLLSYGTLPQKAAELELEAVDQTFGPPDRVVRLRFDPLDHGELKVRYDGWQFHDASLRLVPKIEGETLRWKCEAVGIPSAWFKDLCFQIEERTTKFGAPPPPEPHRAEASTNTAPPAIPDGPPSWEPPFRSSGPANADAAVITEGLRQLEPFQRAAQEYYNSHHALPSSADEIRTMFTAEQLQLQIVEHAAHVSFGPLGDVYLDFEGFSVPLTMEVTPGIDFDTGRLGWRCFATGEHGGILIPPECGSR